MTEHNTLLRSEFSRIPDFQSDIITLEGAYFLAYIVFQPQAI